MNRILLLIEELEQSVLQKESELSDVIRDSPALIKELEDGFMKLREILSNYTFDSKSEEIHFFKITKPALFSKLIYYRKIYQIELNKPISSFQMQKAYLKKEQEQIDDFYTKNAEFIRYYRSGNTSMDEFCFLRRKNNEINLEPFYFEYDPKFSTLNDFKVSCLLSNEKLAVYLNNELIKIKQQENMTLPSVKLPVSNDKWTDTKCAMVELIYAIHSVESVNMGNIDLKILARHFENAFNIELGDLYRVFLEIRGRKGNRAVYLNRLEKALNKRMDEADARP